VKIIQYLKCVATVPCDLSLVTPLVFWH